MGRVQGLQPNERCGHRCCRTGRHWGNESERSELRWRWCCGWYWWRRVLTRGYEDETDDQTESPLALLRVALRPVVFVPLGSGEFHPAVLGRSPGISSARSGNDEPHRRPAVGRSAGTARAAAVRAGRQNGDYCPSPGPSADDSGFEPGRRSPFGAFSEESSRSLTRVVSRQGAIARRCDRASEPVRGNGQERREGTPRRMQHASEHLAATDVPTASRRSSTRVTSRHRNRSRGPWNDSRKWTTVSCSSN